ncbi:MAG: sigma-70 family RNA polymerase sigma factor [Planctomycetes bacterium]|nr:sigma-70 family RNA polymerase sigma factor [Planctomycetota bacterium]
MNRVKNESQDEYKEGDFLKLFLKHENALRAFARSLLPDWSSVDDVLQESSLVMWEKLDQLHSEDGFLPWGKVIVRFKSMNYLQKLKSHKKVFGSKLLDLLADEATMISDQGMSEHRDALEQCLEDFSPKDKELVFAPYRNRGGIKHIAKILQKTENALYKKMGRLRESLALCIRGKVELPS